LEKLFGDEDFVTDFGLRRSALVLTTTPPFPREYGNRNRVFQTTQFLRNQGFAISLLLYPLDEDWVSAIPSYYRDLVEQFEYFSVIPNKRTLHLAAAAYHHTVDEWWDDSIGEHLSWLFRRRRFDICFVNYTFLSKAFEFAPPRVLRILDTQDLFTGRREIFERHGVAPEFFYTNATEEAIAFDRADLIISIKASESEVIRTITKKHVITLPYWADDPRPIKESPVVAAPRRTFSHDQPLRIGFIGAHNSVNIVNIRRFLHVFDRYIKLYNLPVEVVIAGNVCRQLRADYCFLTKLGRIANIADFYHRIDAVIAPLEFSTGLKIKVGEALVWGLPVVATANAFDGFRSFSPTQVEPSIASLCQSLVAISTNELAYSSLVIAARRAARAASQAQKEGFTELHNWIKNNSPRMFVITDCPFWNRSTFLDEWITQTIERASHIAPTIVLALGDDVIRSSPVYAGVEYLRPRGEDDLVKLLREASANCRIKGVLAFVGGARLESVTAAVTALNIDAWVGAPSTLGSRPAMQFTSLRDCREAVTVSPLRHAPIQSTKVLDATRVILFRPELISEWARCVIMYIEEFCECLKLTVSSILVSPDAQNDPHFYSQSVLDSAARIVMLDCDGVGPVFVQQLALYLNARCLLLAPSYFCPQAVSPLHSPPSLSECIEGFLSGDGSANVAVGANSGWEALWTALERT
jgi:glycosyltransferase involved in cell wall biosynthesis